MKSTFTSFLRKLLGIDNGARLARLPFILAHVLGYSLLFFILQFIKFASQGTAGISSMGDFTFHIILLAVTIILFPIHVRRAHDLGWSLRMPLYFSVIPSILRIALLMIPLFVLLNPGSSELIGKLFVIMPYIGLVFWALNQIQLVFMVLLFFAPGTGVHNRFAGPVETTFNLKNLYGFSMLKKLAKTDSPK